MAAGSLLTLCSLVSTLLTQTSTEDRPRPDSPAKTPAETRPEPLSDAPLTKRTPQDQRPRVERAPDPLPQMRTDLPVACGHLQPTTAVPSGYYRIQCDEKAKICLVTPTKVLDHEGVETDEPLSRVMECSGYYTEDYNQKASQGFRFVPAVPDSPPGWLRDERGRVMQVNFDLNRRVYLGAAYSGQLLGGGSQVDHQVRSDFGIEIEFPGESRHVLNRLHVLPSELYLSSSVYADASLLRYDWSTDRQEPFLRITTFIGTPKRWDLKFDAGGWFEALHLEHVRRASVSQTFLTLGSAHLGLDVWHSKDLSSYLRIHFGPSVEVDLANRFTTFKPQVALDADITLDDDGFHHLRLEGNAEKVLFDPAVDGRMRNPSRLKLRAGYEVVLLAVNDYPLSLVVDGRGIWREDLPFVAPGWEWTFNAGLRFSFWAPARRTAKPLQYLQ